MPWLVLLPLLQVPGDTIIIRQTQGLAAAARTFFPKLVVGILLVFAAWWGGVALRRAILRGYQRVGRHPEVALAFGRLAQAIILFVGLLLAATLVFPSFTPASLIQLLGIGGVAIGFAFKDILQNFLAGILILITNPFEIGDQIVYGAFEGTVERIETRATLLQTYDNRRVVLPNSDLFTNAVTVNTAYGLRCSEQDVNVPPQDLASARRAILDRVHGIEGVLASPPPQALITAITAGKVTLRVRWWSAARHETVAVVRDRVLQAILDASTAHGFTLV